MNSHPATQPTKPEPYELTDSDRAMLVFERQWWHYPGTKENEIRSRFGISATRYYQLLNALIDRPEAMLADPMTVRRLRRLRKARRARRRGVG